MTARRVLDATPAPALELAAILSIHLGAALATRLFAAWGEQGTALVRLALGAVVLALLSRPRLATVGRGALLGMLAFGAILAGLNLFFYEALARLPLGVVATVEFAGPLTVALAGTRRLRDLAWALSALTGIVLLAPFGSGRLDPVGLAYAAAAATCLGLYIVVGGRLGRALPGLQGLASAMAVAAVVLLPFGVASAGRRLLEPDLIVLGIGVAVVSTIVPFALEYEAMRRMRPRAFGVLLSSEPAVATVVGIVLLGDPLGWRQLLALAAITVASVGSTLGERGR